MFVILPFEKDFYATYDYEVDYVGHPLLDAIRDLPASNDFRKRNELSEKPIIAILPGSRSQEIKSLLMTMLEMVDLFPNYQFIIAGAPAIGLEMYQKIIANFNQKNQTNIDVTIVHQQTYDLLKNTKAALVASGTATLETALFNVPQVVGYKGGKISYELFKIIVKIKYISLVNLIMDKEVVTELIQDDFNPKRLQLELETILEPANHKAMQNEYVTLHTRLGNGSASAKVAESISDFLTH